VATDGVIDATGVAIRRIFDDDACCAQGQALLIWVTNIEILPRRSQIET